MELFKEIIRIIIAFVVVSLLLLLLKISTIPEFTASFTSIPIVLTAISVIISTATFYLIHIKGSDITLKVRDIELDVSIVSIPALFVNEGSKPGILFCDMNWKTFYPPIVRLPEYLDNFGSKAEIKFDTVESRIKLAPGESIDCTIHINHVNENIPNKSDKIKELNKLFIKHKEIEFDVLYFATTKEGLQGISKKFKLRTKANH